MKTLLLSEIFPPRIGGSGQWFWEIYRRQNLRDYQILAGHCPDDESFDRESELDVLRFQFSSDSWSIMNLAGIRYYWHMFKNVRRQIRSSGATRLHCARVMPEGVVAWMLKRTSGIAYDCYVHGEDIELARQSRESRWLVNQVIKGAHTMICNSHNSARLLREHWPVSEEQIVVMHPGVDTEHFAPSVDSSVLRDQLGWTDRTVVLTVSRLEKRKGHDMMIQALPQIRESVPNVLYAIVGNGEEKAPLEALAKSLGVQDCVEFGGAADDAQLLNCYQACDLFALPNRQHGTSIEGFGIVLLEAQACAKPVLAGDSGGTAETMIHGTTGLVADCTTADRVAVAVIDLLTDTQRLKSMGNAARQHTIEAFSWNNLGEHARSMFAARS